MKFAGGKTQQKNFLLKSEMFIDSIQKYESDVWSKMAKKVFAVLPHLSLLKLLINFIFAVQAR